VMGDQQNKRKGVFGRAFDTARWLSPSLSNTINLKRIRRSGVFIQDLAEVVRTQHCRGYAGIILDSSGKIDLQATAAAMNMDAASFMGRIYLRRDQTRRGALGSFCLGWVVLLFWLYEMLFLSWSGSRLLSGLFFLPFCASLFVFAFRNAWLNWQLRTRRVGGTGSATAFLTTTEGFLPR